MPIQGLTRFSDKIVMVTGAASGIGKATACRFYDEGATVIFLDRDADSLQDVVARLDETRAIGTTTDISDDAQVASLERFVLQRFDKLDVLVNNAGVTAMGTVLDTDLSDWDRVAGTTLRGTINMCRTFLPLLQRTKGNIVNVASVSGIRSEWNTAYYNAAKGGVVNLTHTLAMDHGRDQVRINAVCPSVTRSAMTQPLLQNADFVEKLKQRIPLGRIADPEDQAAAILFLASDDASFITGAILPVDGGVTSSSGQPPMPK